MTWLVALVPVLLLLFLLAGLRMSAWLAVLIGSIVTFLLGLWVWRMPLADGLRAYLYGSATGIWNVDWITFWGVMLFNTLVTTGSFDKLRRWLVQLGTRDVRVQTILFAWAFGALLEGLVGFGYPWAFVAPILIAIGIPDLDAIRVAAIANNAPVSYGALGAPIIALATVTAGTLGMTFVELLPIYSASVGKIVAILALLPPWILPSGVGQQRHVVSVAARNRRIARLHRGAIADRRLSRAVSAGRHRRDRVLRCFARLAQGMAAGACPRLRRCTRNRRHPGRGARSIGRRRRHGVVADRDTDRGGGRLDRALVEACRDPSSPHRGHRDVRPARRRADPCHF